MGICHLRALGKVAQSTDGQQLEMGCLRLPHGLVAVGID
jgi:hypothetical protein